MLVIIGVNFLVPYTTTVQMANILILVCLNDIKGLDHYHTHSYINYRDMVPLGDRVTLSIPYMLALPDTYSVT